jgi:hypothetical protein
MTYNTDILEAETIRVMQRRYVRLLESIVRDPEARLSMLEIIPEEEKEQQVLRKMKRRKTHEDKLKSVRRRAATSSPHVGDD